MTRPFPIRQLAGLLRFTECCRSRGVWWYVQPGLLLSWESAAKIRFYFNKDSRGGEKKRPRTHTSYLHNLHKAWNESLLHSSSSWLAQLSLFCVCAFVCSCPSKKWHSVSVAHISVCICVLPVFWLTKRAVFPPFPVHHGAVQPLLTELHSHGEKLREGTHQWVHRPFLLSSVFILLSLLLSVLAGENWPNNWDWHYILIINFNDTSIQDFQVFFSV